MSRSTESQNEKDLFNSPFTFMGVPSSTIAEGSRAAILGIPFDCGTHPVRIGARYGPNAIREQSTLVRPFQPPHADFNPLEQLNLIDCGNVKLTSSLIEESFERIEHAVSKVVGAGAVPVTMGGDGAVTLPQLRALHSHYSDLVVLHIDAHTDTFPSSGSAIHDRYNVATTFTRAAEEGVVDTENSIHVGPRGTLTQPNVFEYTREHGYELIDGNELFDRGFDSILTHIHDKLNGKPVYLCFDMDFFDPSCAPGVCTPTWGGATAREGLKLLQRLAGLNIVAVDVNTVSPPHDVGGMTAFLAGTVLLESLSLICLGPQNLQD